MKLWGADFALSDTGSVPTGPFREPLKTVAGKEDARPAPGQQLTGPSRALREAKCKKATSTPSCPLFLCLRDGLGIDWCWAPQRASCLRLALAPSDPKAGRATYEPPQ